MNLIARLLFFVAIIFVCNSVYSLNPQVTTPSQNNKAYEFIESNINKSASTLNISQPSITWKKNNNGAVAIIEYRNKKIKIPFSMEELDSAAQDHLAPKTKNRINQFLITLPGGGGPLP